MATAAEEGLHQSESEPTASETMRWAGRKSAPGGHVIDEKRHVRFRKQIRVQLIPADQLPSRDQHMERSVSNPLRRLWVLYRLFQVGGHYYSELGKKGEMITVKPNTPWPKQWGSPPPLPTLRATTEEWRGGESNESISEELSE